MQILLTSEYHQVPTPLLALREKAEALLSVNQQLIDGKSMITLNDSHDKPFNMRTTSPLSFEMIRILPKSSVHAANVPSGERMIDSACLRLSGRPYLQKMELHVDDSAQLLPPHVYI